MQVHSITATFRRSRQPANYENATAEISASIVLDDGEDWNDAARHALAGAQVHVYEALGMQQALQSVTERLNGGAAPAPAPAPTPPQPQEDGEPDDGEEYTTFVEGGQFKHQGSRWSYTAGQRAQELNVEIRDVVGTGKNGRVTTRDVEDFARRKGKKVDASTKSGKKAAEASAAAKQAAHNPSASASDEVAELDKDWPKEPETPAEDEFSDDDDLLPPGGEEAPAKAEEPEQTDVEDDLDFDFDGEGEAQAAQTPRYSVADAQKAAHECAQTAGAQAIKKLMVDEYQVKKISDIPAERRDRFVEEVEQIKRGRRGK